MLIEELIQFENELIKFRNKLSPEITNFKLDKKTKHIICVLASSIDLAISNIIKLRNILKSGSDVLTEIDKLSGAGK